MPFIYSLIPIKTTKNEENKKQLWPHKSNRGIEEEEEEKQFFNLVLIESVNNCTVLDNVLYCGKKIIEFEF